MELFISTGEISGDLHGGRLLEELHRSAPSLKAFGIGGPRLTEAGLEKTADISELSLVGITEVLPRLKSILTLLSETRALLERRRPAAVILIDSPDFNLRLARHARALGIRTIYYIGPTVWAWRKGRIRAIRDSVDLMLAVLPFEEELYRSQGVRCRFVGHPLVDTVREASAGFSPSAFLAEAAVPEGRTPVSLLPGSRRNEIRLLMPILLRAARSLSRRNPSLHFLVPAASPELLDAIRTALGGSLPNCSVLHGQAAACLASSRAAAVTSGTATLEAALIGTPFATVYRLAPLSYAVGRLLVSSPYISLPNILARRRIVPELIQSECTPENVVRELLPLLEDGSAVSAMTRSFDELRDNLGEGNAAARAAAMVASEVGLAPVPNPLN